MGTGQYRKVWRPHSQHADRSPTAQASCWCVQSVLTASRPWSQLRLGHLTPATPSAGQGFGSDLAILGANPNMSDVRSVHRAPWWAAEGGPIGYGWGRTLPVCKPVHPFSSANHLSPQDKEMVSKNCESSQVQPYASFQG